VTCRQQNTAPARHTGCASRRQQDPNRIAVTGHRPPYPGTGTIILINRKEGWIEIKHEEIKGLMPR